MLKQLCLIFSVLFACYIGVHSEELTHVTHELGVNVHASKVWVLYRNLGISKLGGFERRWYWGWNHPQIHHYSSQGIQAIQKFITIDDQNMIKIAKGLEGIGCSVQIAEIDIVDETPTTSIIISDISYAVKKGFEAKDPKPDIQLLAAAAHVAKHFLENHYA